MDLITDDCDCEAGNEYYKEVVPEDVLEMMWREGVVLLWGPPIVPLYGLALTNST